MMEGPHRFGKYDVGYFHQAVPRKLSITEWCTTLSNFMRCHLACLCYTRFVKTDCWADKSCLNCSALRLCSSPVNFYLTLNSLCIKFTCLRISQITLSIFLNHPFLLNHTAFFFSVVVFLSQFHIKVQSCPPKSPTLTNSTSDDRM